MSLSKKNIIEIFTEAQDFITKKTQEDPEVGSTTWVVQYKPNLKRIYSEIDKIVIQLEKVQKRIQTNQSLELLTIAKTLRNKYSRLLKKYGEIEEISTTNTGGSSFLAGEGEQHASSKSNNKKYYFKIGYKNIPKNKPKSFDKVQLWEKEKLKEFNNFQNKRLQSLEDIESILNELPPLVSNLKNKISSEFAENPKSYDINSPIEIVKSYLEEIKTLLTEKQ